jgi:hypothetical protein
MTNVSATLKESETASESDIERESDSILDVVSAEAFAGAEATGAASFCPDGFPFAF